MEQQKLTDHYLRYSLFVVLYPVGISSEWWLMYKSISITNSNALAALYCFFLALYGPGKRAPLRHSYHTNPGLILSQIDRIHYDVQVHVEATAEGVGTGIIHFRVKQKALEWTTRALCVYLRSGL